MCIDASTKHYSIDICLCIDKTESMRPCIEAIKVQVLNLYNNITRHLERAGKYVDRLRIKVVLFGDYLADGDDAILLSDFLTMPDEMDTFRSIIASIVPDGGGDAPEDGLEALAYAMRSDWCIDGQRRRHIIVLITDADAHPLGFGRKASNYPQIGMPTDFSELSAMWGDEDNAGEMDYQAKRLLLFAPGTGVWKTISSCWENVVIREIQDAADLSDVSITNVVLGNPMEKYLSC